MGEKADPGYRKIQIVRSFCELCTVKSKLYNFAQHELSAKHKSKITAVNQNTKTSFVTKRNSEMEKNIKHAEIKLAVAVTCHCSVMAVGHHFSDVIKSHGKRKCSGKYKIT